jgi:putative transposase
MIEPGHDRIPLSRQCELLGLPRASFYYRPRPITALEALLLRLIDEVYTRCPFYGVRRITAWLRRQGHAVNPKRVRRLMHRMGVEALAPRRTLSLPAPGHPTYPYLLRDLRIERPNQVWCTDLTYVRLASGFVYLTAIMDWHSRYVLSWELSISMETRCCLTALERALSIATPAIFNSDQGSQFTSAEFTERLLNAGVLISRDGRGRVFDNIFIERLWRSVKYEEVYLKDYQTVREAKEGLGNYFRFYNTERPHAALSYRTPLEVYLGKARLTPTPPQPLYVHLNQPLFLS